MIGVEAESPRFCLPASSRSSANFSLPYQCRGISWNPSLSGRLLSLKKPSHTNTLSKCFLIHLSILAIMNLFMPTPLYYFIVCYILVQAGYFISRQITTRINRRRIIEENGCEPPPSFDGKSRMPHLFRLKFVKTIRSAAAERTSLKAAQRRYRAYGNTHSATVSLHQTDYRL